MIGTGAGLAGASFDPTMRRSLHPSLRVAASGRDLVFLDLRAGAYDLMPGAGDCAVVHPSGQAVTIKDMDLEAALTQAGRLRSTPAYLDEPPLPALPKASALSLDDQPWTPSLWARWVAACLMTRQGGKSFSTLVQLRSSTKGVIPASPHAVLQLARGFDQRLPWVPLQGDCLFRCLLLRRMMTPAERREVQWVFAVKTWPFHAHCWLQLGETVLTDHFEPLATFTPIFAL